MAEKLLHIVWDYNGTLIDDVDLWVRAAIKYYEKYDEQVDKQRMRDIYDTPIVAMAKTLGINYSDYTDDFNSAATKLFHEIYEAGIGAVTLREGVLGVLEHLNKLGIQQSVVSNHDQVRLEEELVAYGVYELFNVISGRAGKDEIIQKTTKSKRIANLMRDKGLSSDQVVLVGDSPEEVRIASEVGIRSVGLLGGYASDKRQHSAGHCAVLEDVKSLSPLLAGL